MLAKNRETISLNNLQRLFVLTGILGTALTLGVAQVIPDSPWGYYGGVGLTFSGIKPLAASANGIGENPWGFQLNGGVHLYRFLLFNTDLGFEFPGDHQKFEQSTTGGQRQSSVITFSLSLSAGAQLPVALTRDPQGPQLTFGVNAGFENLGGHRSIGDCVDCREDDIDLNDGTYLQPVLQLTLDGGDMETLGIGISYRFYSVDADLKGKLLITLLMFGLF